MPCKTASPTPKATAYAITCISTDDFFEISRPTRDIASGSHKTRYALHPALSRFLVSSFFPSEPESSENSFLNKSNDGCTILNRVQEKNEQARPVLVVPKSIPHIILSALFSCAELFPGVLRNIHLKSHEVVFSARSFRPTRYIGGCFLETTLKIGLVSPG